MNMKDIFRFDGPVTIKREAPPELGRSRATMRALLKLLHVDLFSKRPIKHDAINES